MLFIDFFYCNILETICLQVLKRLNRDMIFKELLDLSNV